MVVTDLPLSDPIPQDPVRAQWPSWVCPSFGKSQAASTRSPARSQSQDRVDSKLRAACHTLLVATWEVALFLVCRHSLWAGPSLTVTVERSSASGITPPALGFCCVSSSGKVAKPNRHLALQGPAEPNSGGLSAGPQALTPWRHSPEELSFGVLPPASTLFS